MTQADEIRALVEDAGWYPLPSLRRFRITGEDRVRWLNGMVTNTVRDLKPGELNYTFLLNAQGRIQGDGWVWAQTDALLFATEQGEKLGEHLDRFIIMDDVELVPEEASAVGVAGVLRMGRAARKYAPMRARGRRSAAHPQRHPPLRHRHYRPHPGAGNWADAGA